MLQFSRLATPPNHGDTLVEPAAGLHPKLIASNRRLLADSSARFAGIDLQTLRHRIRSELVVDPDAPLIVTGHQPEFIHPGVWAKHVVAVRLADATGGTAINLVADNDAPKETGLAVPSFESKRLQRLIVPYANAPPNVAYENIAPVDGPGRLKFESQVRTALGQRFETSMLGDYFTAVEADSGNGADWVDQMVGARRALEGTLGIELVDHRISRVWYGPMLAEILGDADRFAASYNQALADYRRKLGVRSSQHPIPDLHQTGDRHELPLWAYRPNEARRRLYVTYRGDRITIYADDDVVGDLPRDSLADWDTADAALRSLGDWRFRPRALMLTLWARLLLADLFVQGIGGAKYDRITDGLIRNYYGFEPPAMIAVSATLHLALPQHDVEPDAARALNLRRRDLIYNPQRQLPESAALRKLGDRKLDVLRELETLRGQDRSARPRRRELFLGVRTLNHEMRALQPTVLADLEHQLATTLQHLQENEMATRRDYFFALYRRRDIEMLLKLLPSAADFGV